MNDPIYIDTYTVAKMIVIPSEENATIETYVRSGWDLIDRNVENSQDYCDDTI